MGKGTEAGWEPRRKVVGMRGNGQGEAVTRGERKGREEGEGKLVRDFMIKCCD